MIRALDIINDVEDRLGYEQSDSIGVAELTDEQRKVVRLLNRVLGAWQGIKDWDLLRTDAEIVLVASVTSSTEADGTDQYVTATQNSKIVTVVNGAFDDTFVGRAFLVCGDKYVYRIESITSPTVINLNRGWVSATIAAGTWNAGTEVWDNSDEKTFIIGSDRYALPADYDRVTGDIQTFFRPYGIHPIGPESLRARRRSSEGIDIGEPDSFTIYGHNDAKTVRLIHFHPFPENARMLLYTYQRNHPKIDSDNDIILIESRYAEALIEMVVMIALRDFMDDDSIQQNLQDMLGALNKQIGTSEVAQDKKVMRLANNRRRQIRAGARYGGLRVDWGEEFDVAGNTGYFD